MENNNKSIIYKIQSRSKVTDEWIDLQIYPGNQYNEAYHSFYKEYKLNINNFKELRLIQITEEILDNLKPEKI